MAADIWTFDNRALWIACLKWSYTQAIFYFRGMTAPEFIHFSYDPGDLRFECLACYLDDEGKRHYEEWKDE